MDTWDVSKTYANIKLSAEQKKQILEKLVNGDAVPEIARNYNVSSRTIGTY
jgi:DNA-binding NarL/FixJ family response regulator